MSTLRVMGLGLFFAILTNIPFYGWVFGENWSWAYSFPLGWLGAGMRYMAVFFHEIGHTAFMWFFGYPALPLFDFKHGGGLSLTPTGQLLPLIIAVWGCLAYGVWIFRGYVLIQILIVCVLVANILLAFNPFHSVLINFMGPGFECVIASFFLFRALFDLAPRGDLERFLNAYFGLGLILQVFVNANGLLKNQAYRLSYYQQKGSHGFGDFDKIADQLRDTDFHGVIAFWMTFNGICLLIPFLCFLFFRNRILAALG